MRMNPQVAAALIAAPALVLASAEVSGGWARQRNGYQEDKVLPGVAAGDASHAYAAGIIDNMGNSQAVIFHTHDGGATWMMAMPDTRTLAMYLSAWAPSGQTCYVGGMSKVFKTGDGGLTWVESQHPDMVGLRPVVGIGGHGESFVVAVAGSMIFVSHDAAASWSSMESPLGDAGLTHVFFLDETTGWIAAGSADRDSDTGEILGYSGGGLIATQDGGATWSVLKEGEEKSYGKPSFINDLEGWIVSMSMSGAELGKTVDGGRSWQPMALPPFSGGSLNSILQVVFFDRCEGFLLGGDQDAKKTGLFYTIDGGETWTEQDTSWAEVEFPPEVPFPFPVFSQLLVMDFAGRETGWVIGTYEFIGRYTADGPGPDCGTGTDASPDAGDGSGTGDGGCGCSIVR